MWPSLHIFKPGICPGREGGVSSFSCSLRDVRAPYDDDCVTGTCILLNPFDGAVVGKCIFRHLFQKLASCKESGIFTDMFINFIGLLENILTCVTNQQR